MTERISVVRDDVSLSVLVTGQTSGPTVLLSNSLGAGLGMWAPQRKMLEPHYRVIGYDTRGHGQSSTPVGDYDFDDLTADALAVLDHLGVEKADYIGLSLGGMTGLGLGLDSPERIDRIVCACARADAPAPFASSWDDRIASIADGGVAAIWPGTLERWLTEEYINENAARIDALKSDFLMTTPNGYCGCAAALKALNYLPRLTEMTVPVLYVSGAEDMGAPTATMHAMWIATPSSEHKDIPNCAHIANLNQEEAFNRAINNFLEI